MENASFDVERIRQFAVDSDMSLGLVVEQLEQADDFVSQAIVSADLPEESTVDRVICLLDIDETQEERFVLVPSVFHEHLQGEYVVDGRPVGSETCLDV